MKKKILFIITKSNFGKASLSLLKNLTGSVHLFGFLLRELAKILKRSCGSSNYSLPHPRFLTSLQELSTHWVFCFVPLTKVLNESCKAPSIRFSRFAHRFPPREFNETEKLRRFSVRSPFLTPPKFDLSNVIKL